MYIFDFSGGFETYQIPKAESAKNKDPEERTTKKILNVRTLPKGNKIVIPSTQKKDLTIYKQFLNPITDQTTYQDIVDKYKRYDLDDVNHVLQIMKDRGARTTNQSRNYDEIVYNKLYRRKYYLSRRV